MDWTRLAALTVAVPLAACATAVKAPPQADFEKARSAVESARQAGASAGTNDCFAKAVGHLKEAEALAHEASAEKTRQAEWLARLAAAEAECAAAVARAAEARRPAHLPEAAECEKLAARLRRAEEEQRRADEHAALLQKELESTELEVIRSKAKLKGIETKAEASSAIAEARILIRRVIEEKGRTPSVLRSQDKLDKAEQQLQLGNYGAAAFFAVQAQELLEVARHEEPSETNRPAPKKQYTVAVASANIREEPNTSSGVIGRAARGAVLDALAVRGDWIKVGYQGITGWVSRSLLE